MLLSLPDRCRLTAGGTNQEVMAGIVPLTRELAKLRITARWWDGLAVTPAGRRLEPDHHWNWTRLAGRWQNRWYAERVAVLTDDGEVQAAAIYRVDALSVLDAGADGQPAPAVYVEYLATAPRNRGRLVPVPAYRGGGSALLVRAVAHSHLLGFGGRVSLAALPRQETERFYGAVGFARTAVEKDGMMVYELQPEPAQLVLTRAGLL